MTNKDFKIIKTNITTFEKVFHFVSDKLNAVIINGVKYSKLKSEGKLTTSQLSEFEFLNDFTNTKGITL